MKVKTCKLCDEYVVDAESEQFLVSSYCEEHVASQVKSMKDASAKLNEFFSGLSVQTEHPWTKQKREAKETTPEE